MLEHEGERIGRVAAFIDHLTVVFGQYTHGEHAALLDLPDGDLALAYSGSIRSSSSAISISGSVHPF